ncbi:MAG: amidase [Actinomycetota bacterium]|nr:amidase [Actinomycetota bacterium]
MGQLHDLTALEAVSALRRGDLGPVELTEHYLDRIERLDAGIGAFVTVTEELARASARHAEEELRRADPAALPPLLGLPTAIKDLNATAGVATKLGSAAFTDWVPDYDDFVVTRLRAAGAISLGKTATPEFGLPCYTETDIGAPVRTPWDTDRLAGGSSGGAAAAVAAGFLPVAQGSDGGGSIRIPASGCGLVGLKPSRGRVSPGPLGPDSTGLGVIGPLARTVRDAALFLDAVAGPMPGDPHWAPPLAPGETFLAACDRRPGRLRIGRYLDSPIATDVDPQVRAAWEGASRLLGDLGHDVEDIAAPIPAEAISHFQTVWAVSAATAVVDPRREHLLRPLTRYLREYGRSVAAVDFARAQSALTGYARRGIAASLRYDAVLTPTVAQLPRPVGWFTVGNPAQDFELQKRFTPWTAMYNTTGQPAISLPMAVSPAVSAGDEPHGELPIGVMLVGRPAGEADLLALAAQVEAAAPWLDRHPPVWWG